MTYKSVSGGNPDESFNRLPERLTLQAPAALVRAALVLEANWKNILLTPGAGRIRRGGREQLGKGSFNRGKDGKLHRVTRGAPRTKIDLTNRASAPGDPPAPDIGTLQRSITHGDVGTSSVGGRGRLGSALVNVSIRVGTNVEYAEPLEYGTTTAGKNHNVVILPRPSARPAAAASREQMTEGVVATLKRGNARG